ncbi:dipeptidase [Candidatus Protochlamydia sp. R18]|uniref:dipeptidase n=1 Tax=Candidatus Protochlamydia sp. R18 TaxID=1353977 RepID=UPI0005A93348|nr:dipeptidase [Candidatus Protochlamydia sp. R18]
MGPSLPSCLAEIKYLIEQNREEWLKEYYTFLSFPSISSETHFQVSLLNCANWVVDYLKTLGFEVELWPTEQDGPPVIYATHLKAGADKPTLLIYNHYDVQPADPLNEWKTDPFQPSLRDGNVYARGAQDNKGQCFYVLQALKFYLKQYSRLPINIKLCIEGEEEIGSAGLSRLLPTKAEALKADYLAIVDLGLRNSQIPAVTLGIRGILTMDVEVQGSDNDLHSGSHGGIAINPIHALVAMLASLRDASGKITVNGFYDDVEEMSLEERSSVSFYFDLADYQKLTGAYPGGGEKDKTALERAWARPTLEINGINGGYTGKGFKTVIPAKASAKISCRLVSQQDPKKIGRLIEHHLNEAAPQGIQVRITIHQGQGRAIRVSPKSQLVASFSEAFQEVFGVPCEFIFEGASIPIVPELGMACGGEVILIGLGLTTDLIHAPNEHFGLDRLEKGILITARAIELLAQHLKDKRLEECSKSLSL